VAEILTVERDSTPASGASISLPRASSPQPWALAGDIDLAEPWRGSVPAGASPRPPHFSALTPMEAVRTLDYDVLVELTVLSVLSVASRRCRTYARARPRRDVVTANKGRSPFAYRELESSPEGAACGSCTNRPSWMARRSSPGAQLAPRLHDPRAVGHSETRRPTSC